MSKETGISWNKGFKSQYGSLTKVLLLSCAVVFSGITYKFRILYLHSDYMSYD